MLHFVSKILSFDISFLYSKQTHCNTQPLKGYRLLTYVLMMLKQSNVTCCVLLYPLQYFSLQDLNRGDSFVSISSSGSNAAIIHYFPTNTTDRGITTEDIYLLDSGGQYL